MSIDINAQVSAKLSRYSKAIQDGLRKSADRRSDELQLRLRKESPKRPKGSKKRQGRYSAGSYARGWRKATTRNDFSEYEITVYNKTHFSLTHLLEKGHAKRGGGRVEPRVHIAPAERNAVESYEKDVRKLINNANKE